MQMPKLTLLDPNKTGRQAVDLENEPHHFVVGEEEAIQQIVRAYQTHMLKSDEIRGRGLAALSVTAPRKPSLRVAA
jgi:hypothetical protein